MNELQQVLIVIAVIVIAVIYFLQRKKTIQPDSTDPSMSKTDYPDSQNNAISRHQAEQALNELGEAHIPVSSNTQHRLNIPDNELVSENQLGLSFGEGFDSPQTVKHDINEQLDLENHTEDEANSLNEPLTTEEPPKAKHLVIVDEEMVAVNGFNEVETEKPNFGIPAASSGLSTERVQKKTNVEKTEPEVFALIVMGTGEFLWPKVNQTLQGVGLIASESQIFVKKDSMGNEIIRVANLLEPGTFPIDEPTNSEYKTPGVVLILELPTTVKAPAVMHDMIMMARKISQRLNGRLYNMERHLIKESDLQQMRDTAVAYESQAL